MGRQEGAGLSSLVTHMPQVISWAWVCGWWLPGGSMGRAPMVAFGSMASHQTTPWGHKGAPVAQCMVWCGEPHHRLLWYLVLSPQCCCSVVV